MRLFINDLRKAEIPPTGNGNGPALPKPKTPGAATTGSGPQIVDCPLGGACPDGGKHEMGSEKFRLHSEQAAKMGQTGKPPGDETSRKETTTPGVTPDSQNIGSLGSDRVPPKTSDTMEVGEEDLKTEQFGEQGTRPVNENQEVPGGGHDENAPDTRQTLKEFPAYASDDASGEGPGSKNQTLHDHVINLDKPVRQNVPNPLSADESKVPHDSKPMDHYKLAGVARESGDEELAKFHEGMARKRTAGMGSEDHKKLAEQLRAEGMNDHADFHDGVHARVNDANKDKASVPMMVTKDQHQQLADLGYSKESRNKMTPEEAHGILDSKNHESGMRDVHHEAKTKANKDLADAKAKHEETKAKAEKLKASNAEKLAKYEEAKKEHEAAKAAGNKKAKPPVKPKLDKEIKVDDEPELQEPKTDADKLKHETHTERAKRMADLAESHLKGNKELSTSERSRLERAHKMAAYHANIGYTPTAAHKKELGEVESAVSGMGIKTSYEDQQKELESKQVDEAIKQAEKDEDAQKKQKAASDKQKAKEAKDAPKLPVTDLDHARMADHGSKAQALKQNIQSHLDANPNMSPEDRAKAQRVLEALKDHESLDVVPSGDKKAELKELHQLAGETGKKFDPTANEGPDGQSVGGSISSPANTSASSQYLMDAVNRGSQLGQQLADADTDDSGGAGKVGAAAANYGITGATQAGHHLLRDHGSNQPIPGDPDAGRKHTQASLENEQ